MVEHDPATVIEPVRRFADNVLEHGRDRLGEHTPLLADAIDPDAERPVPYDARDVIDDAPLSNFAAQQEFLRTLVGLSALTGEGRYREAAEELVEYVLSELTDSTGLIYWGGHMAYDLAADELATSRKDPHELKWEYPFYDLFWEVDPDATRRFVEAFWNAHVSDWSILDFNRHGDWDDDMGPLWDHEYEGGDVFFWGDGLTFVNTGSDLYYAAGTLADLDGDDAPLAWAERLAERYVETRGETGISGYQFSQHASYCNGPAIRGDRAQYQFAPYIPGDHTVYEGTLFRPRPTVQYHQFQLGDRLGERGERFTRWALEELEAWREAAYRPEENTFEPMLTDGLSLEGFTIRREGYFGPKGRIVGPIEAGPEFLWVYARAYRATGAEFAWETARDVARGNGYGDIGTPEGDADLSPGTGDYRALYGFLELFRATGDDGYLDAAWDVGEAIVDGQYRDGWFREGGLALLDDHAPLALLHLAAATEGEPDAVPAFNGGGTGPSGGI